MVVCVIAVRRVQGDVVQAAVGVPVQLPMGEQAHQQFTDAPWPKGDLSRPIQRAAGINQVGYPRPWATIGCNPLSSLEPSCLWRGDHCPNWRDDASGLMGPVQAARRAIW